MNSVLTLHRLSTCRGGPSVTGQSLPDSVLFGPCAPNNQHFHYLFIILNLTCNTFNMSWFRAEAVLFCVVICYRALIVRQSAFLVLLSLNNTAYVGAVNGKRRRLFYWLDSMNINGDTDRLEWPSSGAKWVGRVVCGLAIYIRWPTSFTMSELQGRKRALQ